MKSLFSTSAKLIFVPVLASALLLGACADKKNADATNPADAKEMGHTDAEHANMDHEQHDQVAGAQDDVAVAEATDGQSTSDQGVAVAEEK